ncbi:hypothetical protein [Niveibacterium sp. SC-1]|uniref:hypothetical protein n=1 Tax=Niveibacterium sp. SC-1 TaxID=3135646 RepID=UPI00311F9364
MRTAVSACLLSLLFISNAAIARNDSVMVPLQPVMDQIAKQGGAVRFYFAKQATPEVAEKLSTFTVSRNGALRAEQSDACQKLAGQVIDQMRERAVSEGADGVVNIRSTYIKGTEVGTETEFECRIGNVRVAIQFSGELVKFKN